MFNYALAKNKHNVCVQKLVTSASLSLHELICYCLPKLTLLQTFPPFDVETHLVTQEELQNVTRLKTTQFVSLKRDYLMTRKAKLKAA